MNRIGRGLRRPLTWLLVAVFILFVLIGRSAAGREDVEPYDSTSNEANGTLAAVRTLDRLGVTVTTSETVPDRGVALVWRDDLTAAQRTQLGELVRTGGTLILGDASSPLARARAADAQFAQPRELEASCSLPVAQGAPRIAPGGRSYAMLTLPDNATGCYGSGRRFALTQYSEGLGTVVQFASPEPFTNTQLAAADNAVLLANAVGAGNETRVTLVTPGRADTGPTGGDATLADFIPHGVNLALLQLIIVAVLFALWRGRRLGNVVTEPQAVELPASALVVAVGNLLQEARRPNAAARTLRHDTRRRLALLMSVDPDVPLPVLISLVASRTGIEEQRLQRALDPTGRVDDDALLRLSQELERLYQEVSHVR